MNVEYSALLHGKRSPSSQCWLSAQPRCKPSDLWLFVNFSRVALNPTQLGSIFAVVFTITCDKIIKE